MKQAVIFGVSDGNDTRKKQLEPPEWYSIVSDGIGRCGALSFNNFSFLALQGYKKFLFLCEDEPHQSTVAFMEKNHIGVKKIPFYEGRARLSWRTQMDEVMKETLEYLLDKSNHPVLITSTSSLTLCTVIGCLRRLQGWSLANIVDEFIRFSPDQPLSPHMAYVEMFDFDLIQMPTE